MSPAEIYKKIRRIQIQTTRLATDILAGPYHSIFKGKGIEFEEVREYQAGDEIRHIDWNVTARMHNPYVKIFREERELTLMLIVDVSGSSHFGKKSELIAEIGGVLSFSAIKNNDRVGLILFTDHVEKYIPPRKGTRHVLWLIRELLLYKPKSKGTDINKALAFYANVQKQTGICFLISDFIQSDFSKAMRLTAKKHDLIAIHTVDPLEQKLPNVGLIRIEDLETGEIQTIDFSNQQVKEHLKQQFLKRKNYLKQTANQTGMGLIELQTDKPYMPLLRKFFKMRERKG